VLFTQTGTVVTNLAMISLMASLLGVFSIFTGIILFTVVTAIRGR